MIRISVIVPTYNDAEGLRTTARSLLDQDFPAERTEILLVDNGSTDDTFRVAEELAALEPARVRALSEREKRGSYAARNRGIAEARGEILCFIDADMSVPPGYLSAVSAHFADPECQYAGCFVDIESRIRSLASETDRLLGFPVDGYLQQLHYAPTCCLSVRATLISTVGPFDPDLFSGGDQEFGRRVHARGIRQDLLAGVRLRHPARTRIRDLAKKRRRVARGHADLVRRYPGRFDDLASSYRWRRLVRSVPPRRFRERARERSVEISRGRSYLLAALQLLLKFIGTREYHRRRRELGREHHSDRESTDL